MSSPTPTSPVAAPRLVARTAEVMSPGLPRDLVDLLPPDSPAAWLRRGEGIVAWGEAARYETEGPDRFTDAVDWWNQKVDERALRNELGKLNDEEKRRLVDELSGELAEAGA